jgi:hypothetical protein
MSVETTKNGVFVPLPLFEAMARCYYGGGNRDRMAPEQGEVQKSVTPPKPEQPMEERTEEPLLSDLVITRTPGWKPRGVAARTMSEPPPENENAR